MVVQLKQIWVKGRTENTAQSAKEGKSTESKNNIWMSAGLSTGTTVAGG